MTWIAVVVDGDSAWLWDVQAGLKLSKEQENEMLTARRRMLSKLNTLVEHRRAIVSQLGMELLQTARVSHPAHTSSQDRARIPLLRREWPLLSHLPKQEREQEKFLSKKPRRTSREGPFFKQWRELGVPWTLGVPLGLEGSKDHVD